MAGVATLSNGAIRVWCVVGILERISRQRYRRRIHNTHHLVGAIVLVIRLADLAIQACPNLSSHTNAVSNLDRRDFVTNLDDLSDDFVTNT